MLLRAHKVDVVDLRAQRLDGATFASIDAGGNAFVWRLTASGSADKVVVTEEILLSATSDVSADAGFGRIALSPTARAHSSAPRPPPPGNSSPCGPYCRS